MFLQYGLVVVERIFVGPFAASAFDDAGLNRSHRWGCGFVGDLVQ